MKKIALLLSLAALLIAPSHVWARIGVGVATGKIIIEEALKPGVTYKLPNFSIVNTGDEPSKYQVSIEYLEGKDELDPPKEWFSADPQEVVLEPNSVGNVSVKLSIPIKAVPGDYFAFVEAHPVKDSQTTVSGASINIAAASKLYFTVQPANIFQGLYYKATSFLADYSPWTYIVLAVVGLAILITILRKRFSFNISVGKKS